MNDTDVLFERDGVRIVFHLATDTAIVVGADVSVYPSDAFDDACRDASRRTGVPLLEVCAAVFCWHSGGDGSRCFCLKHHEGDHAHGWLEDGGPR